MSIKNKADKEKNDVFIIVQDFLKNPPLIVWGSGATIPFGLPSMKDLNCFTVKSISKWHIVI
jgi:hypothetical protein